MSLQQEVIKLEGIIHDLYLSGSKRIRALILEFFDDIEDEENMFFGWLPEKPMHADIYRRLTDTEIKKWNRRMNRLGFDGDFKRISRKQAISLLMNYKISLFFDDLKKEFKYTLSNVYREGIEGEYDILKRYLDKEGIQPEQDIKKLYDSVYEQPTGNDQKTIDKRMDEKRIKLSNDLKQSLFRSLIQDEKPSLNRSARNTNNDMKRFLSYESSRILHSSIKKCFDAFGVERYELIAVLDSRTSDICRGMNGKVFSTREYEIGVTAPPFHQHCRTTVSPIQ